MIVDAHHHLWRIGQNGHKWPMQDLAAIHRDFELADLARTLEGTGVSSTIVVQSQPSHLDTDWLLDLAGESDLIAGVVGWTDLAAPNAPARVHDLAQKPKLKGLRPMLQGLPEDDWILRPEVRPALTAMIDGGLSLDALVFTRHLPAIIAIASAFPALDIVIDHAAKPPFAHPEEMPLWHERMREAGRLPNITCKLSGLFTELKPDQNTDEVVPVVDELVSIFGPDRLMWGSDWPVIDLAGNYRAWLDWTQRWLDNKSATAQEAILSRTARTFYRLD